MKKQYIIGIISVISVLAIALIIWGIVMLVNKDTTLNSDSFVSCKAYSALGDETVDEKLSDADLNRIKNIFAGRTLTSDMPDCEFSDDFKLYMTTSEGVEHEFLLATDNSGYIFWRSKGDYFLISAAQQKLLTRILDDYGFIFPEEN